MSLAPLPEQWIVPQWPAPARVRALSTTRHGGVSVGPYTSFNVGDAVGDRPEDVAANRARLRACLPSEPLWLRQVHGTRIIRPEHYRPEIEADGAVTIEAGVVLAIQSADCMPVLLTGRGGATIAAVHAGWRGLAGGVIENALRAMAIPAGDVVAWLGPAIGAAAYEVGDDVRAAFTAHDPAASLAFAPRSRPGKYLLDLYALARQRFAAAGVNAVYGGEFCTFQERERFFSFRRDAVTGRMATLLWLEP